MPGLGDVVGCVSLSIQAFSGLPQIYAFFESFKSSSAQAQKIADECGGLLTIKSHIETLATRLRTLPGPTSIHSTILLRAAITSCQKTIDEIQSKINKIRLGPLASKWEQLRTTAISSFFPEIHASLSKERENLTLCLLLVVFELLVDCGTSQQIQIVVEAMASLDARMNAANNPNTTQPTHEDRLFAAYDARLGSLQAILEQLTQHRGHVTDAYPAEVLPTEDHTSGTTSRNHPRLPIIRQKARRVIIPKNRHEQASKSSEAPRSTSLEKSPSHPDRNTKTYSMRIIVPDQVKHVINGRVVERNNYTTLRDWVEVERGEVDVDIQRLIMIRGLMWLMKKVHYTNPFTSQPGGHISSSLAQEGALLFTGIATDVYTRLRVALSQSLLLRDIKPCIADIPPSLVDGYLYWSLSHVENLSMTRYPLDLLIRLATSIGPPLDWTQYGRHTITVKQPLPGSSSLIFTIGDPRWADR